MAEKRDFVTPTVALLVLISMLVFAYTGKRDDKAWKGMTEWIGSFTGDYDAKPGLKEK